MKFEKIANIRKFSSKVVSVQINTAPAQLEHRPSFCELGKSLNLADGDGANGLGRLIWWTMIRKKPFTKSFGAYNLTQTAVYPPILTMVGRGPRPLEKFFKKYTGKYYLKYVFFMKNFERFSYIYFYEDGLSRSWKCKIQRSQGVCCMAGLGPNKN